MIHLDNEAYFKAVEAVQAGMEDAEKVGVITDAAKAMLILAALGESFDIEAMDEGPEATPVPPIVYALHPFALPEDFETKQANAIREWSQGLRP